MPALGWDAPGCGGPSLSSWNICSKARNGCSLCSFAHIKGCHLAPGNLPAQASLGYGSGTPTGWPQQHLIGKHGSELSGGSGAV